MLIYLFIQVSRPWSSLVGAHLWSPQSCPLRCAFPWWRRTPGWRRWPQETARRWGKCSSCLEPGPRGGDKSVKFSVLRQLASAPALPAPVRAHRFWDDRSKCIVLPHQQAPIPPGERRRSGGPTAVPEGRRLRGEQRHVRFWAGQVFLFFLFQIKTTHSQHQTKKGQIRFHV